MRRMTWRSGLKRCDSVLKGTFSSTCAVYGDQDGVTLDEGCETRPINSYASSKRAIEDMARDFGAAHGLVMPMCRRARALRPRCGE